MPATAAITSVGVTDCSEMKRATNRMFDRQEEKVPMQWWIAVIVYVVLSRSSTPLHGDGCVTGLFICFAVLLQSEEVELGCPLKGTAM